MYTTTHLMDDTCVVAAQAPAGAIDPGDLEKALSEALHLATSIVLDLSDVDRICPRSLRVILEANHRIWRRRGCFALVVPEGKVRRIIEHARLNWSLDIFNSSGAAVRCLHEAA